MCTFLDIQNPPVIPGEDRWLGPLKAEPQEIFGLGVQTPILTRYDWMSRDGKNIPLNLGIFTYNYHTNQPN